MFKSLLLPLLLLSVTSGAFAETPKTAAAAAAQLTPEQKVQVEKQNAQMAQASLQVASMVDQNKIGEVWDGASSVAKQANARGIRHADRC